MAINIDNCTNKDPKNPSGGEEDAVTARRIVVTNCTHNKLSAFSKAEG